MVGPARSPSQNFSSRYPTIRVSKASDAQTPSNRVIRNLNPDFNVVRLQTIMESIQRMVPQDSHLVALAQQATKAVGQIVAAEPSVGNHQCEPSIGNRSNNLAKHAQREEGTSANDNRCLAEGVSHRRITQNRRQWEYGHDLADLRNVSDDRRRHRARMSSPQRRLPVQGPTPSGRGAFHTLAPELKQVAWPDKFKPEPRSGTAAPRPMRRFHPRTIIDFHRMHRLGGIMRIRR
jgi:hypothetical protein